MHNKKRIIQLVSILLCQFLFVAIAWGQTNEPRNTNGMVYGDLNSSWLMGYWEFSYKSEGPKIFWNQENSIIKSLEFDSINMGPGGQVLLKIRGNDSYSGNFTLNKNREGSLEVWVFFGSFRIEFIVSNDFGKLVHKSGGAYFTKK